MRTETQVTLYLNTITANENLAVDPQGYLIKIFMSCSSVNSKVFKVHSNVIKLNQTLKIKNIIAKQLQFWLCTTSKNIIAVGQMVLDKKQGTFGLQLKMLATDFAKIQGTLEIRQYQIQKQIHVEPDQQLLKKVQDPNQKRKQQQQQKKIKQAAQLAEAAKNVKKPAVTLTRFNKKNEPFV